MRPRNAVRRLMDRPQASEAPGTEINGFLYAFTYKKTLTTPSSKGHA
ncbi:hypothetical protein [Bacillus sp. CHD6a]|nr:hypothetical protein [Bacillus sp. CHD6a]